MLPDISWLADPFTGGAIAITEAGVYPSLQSFPVGGTSLATPMFSALWATANQEAAVPLGQAARHLYSMPASTISDVVPVGSPNNVTATIQDGFTTTKLTADQLAAEAAFSESYCRTTPADRPDERAYRFAPA